MAKAIKSASIFVALFMFFLVISEIPKIGAHDSDCLEEYGGNVGFGFCAPKIFPTICYTRCREDKEANGGKCLWEQGGVVKCLCDFCSDSTLLIKL